MKFSLIMATIGNVDDVKLFMDSLRKQNYDNFELIIVDQNQDGRLLSVIEEFNKYFSITHVYSEKGLSRARNVGLKYVTGDIIAFPDDDCIYPENLLDKLYKVFHLNPTYDGVFIQMQDYKNKLFRPNSSVKSQYVNFYNVWDLAASITMFYRRYVVEKVEEFDELLGVGSGTPWGAAEDNDYPIRAMKEGYHIYYLNNIDVHHLLKSNLPHKILIEKQYLYSSGIGYVISKHNYPFKYKVKRIIRCLFSIIKQTLLLKPSNVHLSYVVFRGYFKGLFLSGKWRQVDK